MVNHSDPAVVVQDFVAMVKLWHVVDGLFIWEYFTTFDYEWSVVKGRRPYRWTIWLYSYARFATLVTFINNMIGLDSSRPINCQLWVSFELFFANTSVATASLLIALRVMAVWNRNKIVSAIALGSWIASFACLIRAVLARSTWSPITSTCVVPNTKDSELNFLVALSTDMTMLLFMLFGLFRLRQENDGLSGLCRFLWNQGLIWLVLINIAYVPPVVCFALNLNAPFNMMFQTPALATLTIAATRMYRSLSDFGARDVSLTTPQRSGFSASVSTPIRVAPVSFDRVDVVVHKGHGGGQYTSSQATSHYDSYVVPDGLSHDKPQGLSIEDSMESGVAK
ncbi:hypothetical protein BC827DRAFT_1272180 [Russula dissimulans]|nr:hypothetical protein BC827DRAFT_1272180 [Russula dissimulans]